MLFFKHYRIEGVIFDIDGTVFRSSLLIRLLDILTLEKVCSENVHREITQVRSKWFKCREYI